jgi:hypothetical protein
MESNLGRGQGSLWAAAQTEEEDSHVDTNVSDEHALGIVGIRKRVYRPYNPQEHHAHDTDLI